MNNKYQRLLINFLFFACLIFSPLTLAANPITPFSKIVFFGDSLSDNGNFYADVLRFMPKSPPYFEGRFSNGLVWSDLVQQYYSAKSQVESVNYAVGGQTAILHNPVNGFLPYTLTMSKDNYLLRSIFTDRSSTLFVIWIGPNDYLPGIKDLNDLSTKVVDSIKATIDSLIYHGGVNFLVINMPDLSRIPEGRDSGYDDLLRAATIAHNIKLDTAIESLKENYKNVNIQLFDFNSLMDDFISHIDKYNKQYNTNIQNIADSCWTGGYTFQQKEVTEQLIAQKIAEQLRTKTQSFATANQVKIDPNELAHYVAQNPELLETFIVSEHNATGVQPCDNPDTYLFWDKVHPTSTTHKLIAYKLTDFINANFKAA